ncbi:BON domain-containing protein [candidate division GN15 bacterium]|nr:BON domain-containing protein [candidate division GN15 bacterium]
MPRDADIELAEEVNEALRRNSQVVATRVDVSVANGHVILEGEVAAFRRKLEILDTVENLLGVKGVTDRIEVKPSAHGSDDEAKDCVERALAADPDIPDENITVVVKNGECTLSGYVLSIPEWELAAQRAGSCEGVLSVKNLLLVDPPSVRKDAQIVEDAERVLRSLEGLDASGITVKCVSGKIILEGEVNSLYAKRRAHRAANTIRSARAVENNISVR